MPPNAPASIPPPPMPGISSASPVPPVVTPMIATPEIDSSGKRSYLKFVIAAAVAIVMAVAGIFIYNKFAYLVTQETAVSTPPPTVQVPAPTKAPQATIETDLQAVDGSLTGLDNNLSAIDAGLADQQGDLSEK